MKRTLAAKATKTRKASASVVAVPDGRTRLKAPPMRVREGVPKMPQSIGLANELRADLGEIPFTAILESIRDALRGMPKVRDERQSELIELRLRNTARVEAKRAVILKDSVNSDVAGQFISRTRPVAIKLAKSGELLAVQDGRYLRFPRWQFDDRSDDGIVPGLRQVLAVMDASPFRKAAWLISPNPRLGGRLPIDLLREGQLDRVFEEATALTSG